MPESVTFDKFMQERFPHLWADGPEGEVVVNLTWLKGFWLAAQQRKENESANRT